jgi:hypothetical protein
MALDTTFRIVVIFHIYEWNVKHMDLFFHYFTVEVEDA